MPAPCCGMNVQVYCTNENGQKTSKVFRNTACLPIGYIGQLLEGRKANAGKERIERLSVTGLSATETVDIREWLA